ncbi:MAG: YafY family protein [Parvibaculaceae bacterium]|jgi:predicted DNA-binding transcriptional regulator YafY|nr:YafY family protein [Parvibaculaceae bacterium]HBM87967.1 YafY family transcriptional regulator [Rhodobiaceae bacterium]|tara:strand:+ start:1591 stop:2292 length:702 start_codon:yes stop_codon:yes gene_type:complete
MRRADRLFDIIEYLRRHRRVVTAAELAEKMEVSVRTIYRDIADLQASRVPIDGEAGLGYLLREGYDLPPLMFNEEEAEALALGARIVAAWGDDELAEASKAVLAKLRAVLPRDLKAQFDALGVMAPPAHYQEEVVIDLARVRRAVRNKKKIRFAYADKGGKASMRTIWPLTLSFYGAVWTVPGWCELRKDFRVFRADRMRDLEVLNERVPSDPDKNLASYLKAEGVTDIGSLT